MHCEKCQRDIQNGQLYDFYYGNQTGKVRRGRQTITTYSIRGKRQSFLCNECLFTYAMQQRAKNFIIAAIVFIVIAAIVGLFALGVQDPNTSLAVTCATILIAAYALSLFLTSFVERKRAENQDFAGLTKNEREDYGSRLGIKIHSADLQSQGFKQFFTPGRMRTLKLSFSPVNTR